MNDIIKKDTLNESIKLISALKLNEEDYELIFKKFIDTLNDSDIKEILATISGISELEDENDLSEVKDRFRILIDRKAKK